MSSGNQQINLATFARTTVGKTRKFVKSLGPGLITGASNDDPSGIATYSQAGAQFGLQLLYLAPLVFPLMISVQEMSARIGVVTHKGIIKIVKEYYPPYVLWLVGLITIPAVMVNIGSDLLAMGAVAHMLMPQIPVNLFSVVAAVSTISTLVFFSYTRVVLVMKWAACLLTVYLFVPFFVQQDWWQVLKSALTPHFQFDLKFIGTVGSVFGATLSAYLFFWESSMEVDDQEHKHGRLFENPDAEIEDLMGEVKNMQQDNFFGMLVANILMFFIIWTCGTTLFSKGITDINSVDQAAEALRPIAGEYAYLLFALGVLAAGFLAVPVLAGSCGYIAAEAFGYPRGLDKKFTEAKVFYLVMFLSIVFSLTINFTGIGAIQALIFSAVVYGITCAPSIFFILDICNNRMIMGRFTNNIWSNIGSAEKLHKSNLGDTQCLKWALRVLVFQIHPTIFYQSAGILNIYLP
jgi:NRAMP (natural resistance-associated macrophage protein)-like metal ion transporter